MLSTSNLKSAQAATYFEKDDYYSHEEGPNQSRWLGEGAQRLNLIGGVEQEIFQQVLQGKSPDGHQLLFSRKIDLATRRAATDFTFSAPKSVSVAALVQGDQRVIKAHHTAVGRAFQVLEERYAQTRVTTETGRHTVRTGNLIAAIFPHGTSREAEPQLHSHCVVMNATQLEDGRWYSFSNDSAIMNKKLLGQIYQNELAIELRKIGYEITQRDHGQFDIKGYAPELLETFSTRRAQIEALMAEWQASGKPVRDSEGNVIRSDVLLRELANLQTRQAKPQIVEAAQLLQNWQSVLAVKGLSLPELPNERSVVTTTGEVTKATPTSIIANAITHCGERDAIFRTTAIEKFAFEHHIGELSITELQQAIAAHPELLTVDETKGKVTTESALQLELATIRLMQQGQGRISAIAPTETVAAYLEPYKLSEEQCSAITLSCRTADQFIGWQGAAGAGKTYALSAFREIAEGQGYEVSGYAPSAAAAHELGDSLNIDTSTVARLLLEASVADKQAEKKRKRKLWLIDEAGLLSMREAQALLTKATEEQARVVFVGDTRQLSAVEAGNPFRSLQAGGMLTAHLDQAHRQQQVQLRQAVQMISQGEVGAGIQVLERAGCISEIEDLQARGERLVSDYLSLPVEERQQTLLLSGTNASRLTLTDQIRQGMQAEGSLGENVYTMESLQRKDLTQVQGRYAGSYETGDVLVAIRNYKRQGLERNEHYRVRAVDAAANTLTLETEGHQLIQINPALCDRKTVYRVLTAEIAAGDRLKWTKNNRIANTRNGQQFTVESITPEGIAQTVTEEGEARTIDLSSAQHIDYAWVSTTYSSQGKTASNVMALIDATTNKEAFYVATSRAKNKVQLYTSSTDDLQQLAERSRANENVSDYLPLFEIVQSEVSQNEINHDEWIPVAQPTATQTAADYAREALGTANRSHHKSQSTTAGRSQTSARAHHRDGSRTAPDVSEFRNLLSGIAEVLEVAELSRTALWITEAAQRINDSAQQLALAAARVTRLHEQLGRTLEQKAERRRCRKLNQSYTATKITKEPLKAGTYTTETAGTQLSAATQPHTIAP
ncbi:MAG: MobF family relaxase, partial [Cyanobacteria bacterium J06649_4]